MPRRPQLSVSLGVFAHNEGRNIVGALQSIAKQKLDLIAIKEIIVISSGSYDRTNELVRQAAKQDSRIRLIEQIRREGKSSAINEFINRSRAEVLIAISGDLRLHTRAVEEISLPFLNPDIGMAGAHPIPLNIQHNPIGRHIRILWHLHHLISIQQPKCGEMVAFRKVIRSIPKESAVDEATLEVLLHLIGYQIVYAPRAIVYNRGPESISDFVKQRRRVYVGHQWVTGKYHYQVSTMKSVSVTKVIRQHLLNHPEDLIPTIQLVGLEALSRLLGWVDFNILNRNPYIWNMVSR